MPFQAFIQHQTVKQSQLKPPVSVSREIVWISPGSGLGARVGDRWVVRRVAVLSVCLSVLSAYSLPVRGESPVLYTGGSPVPTPSPGVLCYHDEVPPRDIPWRRLMASGGTPSNTTPLKTRGGLGTSHTFPPG